MAFLTGSGKPQFTKYGLPYLHNSGDETTVPSNGRQIEGPDVQDNSGAGCGEALAIGHNRIVIGAPSYDTNYDHGAIFIYDLDGNQLVSKPNNITTDASRFGFSVAIANQRIVVGEPYYGSTNAGRIHVFDLTGHLKYRVAPTSTSNDQNGTTVAAGCGVFAAYAAGYDSVTYTDRGAVYVYDITDGSLIKAITSYPNANDNDFSNFGTSLAIDHNRLIIGDPGANLVIGGSKGAVYIYDTAGNFMKEIIKSDASEINYFGSAVAIGQGRIVVGAQNDDTIDGSDHGAIYIFDLDGKEVVKRPLHPVDSSPYFPGSAEFGKSGITSIAIGNGRILVTGTGGSAFATQWYLFDLNGNYITTGYVEKTSAKDPCAIGYGRMIIGNAQYDGTNENNIGAFYMYDTPDVMTIFDERDRMLGLR